jgi:hypothetical protein
MGSSGGGEMVKVGSAREERLLSLLASRRRVAQL